MQWHYICSVTPEETRSVQKLILTVLIGVGIGVSSAQGAEVIVRMATLGKDGPTGTFQEGEGELAW